MKIIKLTKKSGAQVKRLLNRRQANLAEVEQQVRKILGQVKAGGDRALIDLTKKFDGVALSKNKIRVSAAEMRQARKQTPQDFIETLKRVSENIRRYHKNQLRKSWERSFGTGLRLGEKIAPIERVGFYIPGGKAPLVSTVLMTVVPAQTAGVKEKVVVTPPSKNGNVDPHILAACDLLGVDEVYRVGGAQAIAAMAYGTSTIKPVDKIVGPGNIYVTAAKKILFGEVGIDMLAGPSEILIIADGTANPAFIAVDLLSQIEHGTGDEIAILLTTSETLTRKVDAQLCKQVVRYYPSKKAQKNVLEKIDCILCPSVKKVIDAANSIGAEHVEVMVGQPDRVVAKLTNAGAIFIGKYAPVSVGDFAAGPSHVLPTAGAARAFSGLSVLDFVKRISIIKCEQPGLSRIGPDAIRLAEVEGLKAHAKAIEMRIKKS